MLLQDRIPFAYHNSNHTHHTCWVSRRPSITLKERASILQYRHLPRGPDLRRRCWAEGSAAQTSWYGGGRRGARVHPSDTHAGSSPPVQPRTDRSPTTSVSMKTGAKSLETASKPRVMRQRTFWGVVSIAANAWVGRTTMANRTSSSTNSG